MSMSGHGNCEQAFFDFFKSWKLFGRLDTFGKFC
jgi:hypothetical protein